MVNKKVVLIISVIAIIIAVVISVIKIHEFNKEPDVVPTDTTVVENEELVNSPELTGEENNIIENQSVNEITEEETKIETETDDNSKDLINKDTEEVVENKVTGEDKAKELAKKTWGSTDNDVYYYLEERLSDNVYIISVRNKETTASLIEYEVNIGTEKVSEY